ncbi:MAG: TetR/AcrR family transcriptional regulator [Sphingobium sp.]
MDNENEPAKIKAPARSRGRPRSGADGAAPDAGVGRDALIDATIELLKSNPPSRITPVVVARYTGVHPSLIRYYFKTRAALLVAVAERVTERFSEQVDAATQDAASTPQSRLCARIGALIDLNSSYPFFHQLIVSEIAMSDDPAAHEMIAKFTNRGQAAYGQILRSGLVDGSFRGMDPGLLYVVVIGMSEFFVSARRQLEIAQGVEIDEAEMRAAYKAFVCDLVLNGVAKKD